VIAALERAVAAAPDDHDLRVHLGRMYLEAGDPGAAVAAAAEVLRVLPDHADARQLMEQTLGESGDFPADEPGTPEIRPGAAAADSGRPHPLTGQERARFDWNAAEDDLGDAAST